MTSFVFLNNMSKIMDITAENSTSEALKFFSYLYLTIHSRFITFSYLDVYFELCLSEAYSLLWIQYWYLSIAILGNSSSVLLFVFFYFLGSYENHISNWRLRNFEYWIFSMLKWNQIFFCRRKVVAAHSSSSANHGYSWGITVLE